MKNNILIIISILSIFLMIGIAEAHVDCSDPTGWAFDAVNIDGCAMWDSCDIQPMMDFFPKTPYLKAAGGTNDAWSTTVTVTNNEIATIVLQSDSCAGNLELTDVGGGDRLLGEARTIGLAPGEDVKFRVDWDVPIDGESKNGALCTLTWEIQAPHPEAGDTCDFRPAFTGYAFENTFVSGLPGAWTAEWNGELDARVTDSGASNTLTIKDDSGNPVVIADVVANTGSTQELDFTEAAGEVSIAE